MHQFFSRFPFSLSCKIKKNGRENEIVCSVCELFSEMAHTRKKASEILRKCQVVNQNFCAAAATAAVAAADVFVCFRC